MKHLEEILTNAAIMRELTKPKVKPKKSNWYLVLKELQETIRKLEKNLVDISKRL